MVQADTFKMWYLGFRATGGWRTGYATSTNGVDWTRYPGNPVIEAGPAGSWDEHDQILSSVLHNGSEFEMWYDAYDPSIGFATSADGLTWAKDPANPILNADAVTISVVKSNGVYRGWYTSFGNVDQIGFAVDSPTPYVAQHPWKGDFQRRDVDGADAPLKISLKNYGRQSGSVTGVSTSSGSFQVEAPSIPFMLDSMQRLTLDVRLEPPSTGTYSDSLIVTTDAPNAPRIAIPLSGTAVTLQPVEPNSLYALSASGHLYTLDPGTGDTSMIGQVPGVVPGNLAIQEKTGKLHTWANDTLYRLGAQSEDYAIVCTGATAGGAGAITFDGGRALYVGTHKGELYKIIVETGEQILLGTTTGYTLTGLAHDSTQNCLWAAAKGFPFGRLDALLKVSTEDGTLTVVGHAGDNLQTRSLTFDNGGNLYGLKRKSGVDWLVRIDTASALVKDSVELGALDLIAVAMFDDVLVDVKEGEPEAQPIRYQLSENYPNPFNPSTTIEFSLPKAGFVTLKIYTILGAEVATLVAEDRPAGAFSVRWDASGMPSGVYFYRLTAGDFVQTRRALLVK
jgi:hypothetical protein